jgi:ankyrin repeat protein
MNKPSLLTRRLSVAHSASFTQDPPPTLTKSEADQNAILYYSCCAGDAAAVATILDEDSNLNINSKHGRSGSTSLFAASLRGKKNVVELLLARPNCDVNLERNDGTTPLIIASQEGHIEIVRLLLKSDSIQVNKASRGRSPLFMACYKSNQEIVSLLVNEKSTNLNQKETEGFDNIVEILLTSELVDVNMVDKCGQTAFFMACLHGHGEVIQLLSVHRDIDASITRDSDHASPLQVACMMGHSSDTIATILATRGTDVGHVNDDGFTAMHYAEESNVNDVIVMLSLLGGTSRKKREKNDELCQVCSIQ